MKAIRTLIFPLLCILLFACAKKPQVSEEPAPLLPLESVSKLDAAKTASQLIIVGATEGSDALVFFLEKQGDSWHEIFATAGYIGKEGLGKTREGDQKTPTGTFELTKAFGIAPDPGCQIGYTQVDDTHYWVGDSDSRYYNQFVSTKERKKFNKKNSEHIIKYPKAYQYCLNIGYNPHGTPKLGSGIFLHCVTDNPYTMGCVAIPEDKMRMILTSIKPDCKIVIAPFAELIKL